jgi:disulfide bond formation protein DsbB
MPSPRKPSLLRISFAWSLLIALVMTAITFLHSFTGELTRAGTGGIEWRAVGWLFLGWLVGAELVLLIGGSLYLAVRRLLRGRRRS